MLLVSVLGLTSTTSLPTVSSPTGPGFTSDTQYRVGDAVRTWDRARETLDFPSFLRREKGLIYLVVRTPDRFIVIRGPDFIMFVECDFISFSR